MKLIIREAVYADLERIYRWIAKDSPKNAAAVIDRILNAIDNTIVMFPYMGRAGSAENTREWVVRGLPYIIVYQVDDERDAISILAVFHGAQNR